MEAACAATWRQQEIAADPLLLAGMADQNAEDLGTGFVGADGGEVTADEKTSGSPLRWV